MGKFNLMGKFNSFFSPISSNHNFLWWKQLKKSHQIMYSFWATSINGCETRICNRGSSRWRGCEERAGGERNLPSQCCMWDIRVFWIEVSRAITSGGDCTTSGHLLCLFSELWGSTNKDLSHYPALDCAYSHKERMVSFLRRKTGSAEKELPGEIIIKSILKMSVSKWYLFLFGNSLVVSDECMHAL